MDNNKMPISVNISTILIIGSYYLSILYFLIYRYIKTNDFKVINPISIVGITIIASIFCLIPYFIRKRIYWVRILYFLLQIPGFLIIILNISFSFRLGFTLGVISTIQYIMQIVAFILLLFNDAKEWFKKVKVS